MRLATLQLGVDGPLDYFVLDKTELTALTSVSDKNPRSKFLYMCSRSGTVWVIGSNRAIRATVSDTEPSDWLRVGVKDLKDMKILQTDALLIRHRSLDVVQLHKVSFDSKNWSIESGANLTIDKEVDGAPRAIASKIVSVPRIGSADYQLKVIESFFALNTGGSVHCVNLGIDFLGTIPKIAAAVGKGQLCKLSPGRGDVPVVFSAESADLATKWRYALLEQGKPIKQKPIPRPKELDDKK